MINKLKKIAKGFTLIETLVAILLLSTAIAGPLTVAQEGLSAALISKDQAGAFYLAQDAIEYLRYKRDSNCLAYQNSNPGQNCTTGGTWLAGIVGSGLCSANGATYCTVDSIQDTVSACSSPTTCPTLSYDSTNHYYCYSGGADLTCTTPTPEQYVRSVQIVTPVCASGGVNCNSDEAQVVVKVSWIGQGGLSHSILVRENLLDWQ